MIETAYDPYLPGFEKLVPGLIEAYDQTGSTDLDLGKAIDVLRAWDLKVSTDSVAMSLAHYYASAYRENVERPAGMSAMETLNYFGTGSPHEERQRMFAMALQKLSADFGTWDTPWGEINRFQRRSAKIENDFNDDEPSTPVGLASGRWGVLAAYGMRGQVETKKIYGTRGNSFIAVVEFGDRVKAKSLLAGGQSGDPNSRHFDDQVERYANHEFKDVPFYKDDVDSRAQTRYHPGE